MDSNLLTKFLNLRLKLQEHFNWLTWAVSYYYYSLMFLEGKEKSVCFDPEELGLPPIVSLDWINGFEWKGTFFRVQTADSSRHLMQEMKALNFLFFDYVQLIDNCKLKEEGVTSDYLSNELIWPLLAYAKVCAMVVMASVCINKYSYEENDKEQVNAFENKLPFEVGLSNLIRYRPKYSKSGTAKSSFKKIISPADEHFKSVQITNINLHSSLTHKKGEESDQGLDHNLIMSDLHPNMQEISQIMERESKDSKAANKDIQLSKYSREDLKESILLSKIESNNLIKVIDDINENGLSGGNQPKFKFMIISALNLVPNLIDVKQNDLLFVEPSENIPLSILNVQRFSTINNKFNIPEDRNSKYNQNIKSNCKLTKTIERIFNTNQKLFQSNADFDSLKYKIISSEENENVKETSNTRINENFLNYSLRQISPNLIKYLDQMTFNRHSSIKKIIDNNKINIKGNAFLVYGLKFPIKLKYSLIKNPKESNKLYSDFLNKSGYLNILHNLSKVIDSDLSINNVVALKDKFHRYGVNTSLELFVLPKLKSAKTADLIKINILCKMLKNFLFHHEGINHIMKVHSLNVNFSSENGILNDGFFDWIKEKGLFNIFRSKVYQLILCILQPEKANEKFLKHFNESFSYISLIKWMKWNSIDEELGINLLASEGYNLSNLILDFVKTANTRPFIFLGTLEHHLSVLIEPGIKYKASISLEQFLYHFNDTFLSEVEPKVTSFIKCRDLSYYLLTKSIHTSRTSTLYHQLPHKNSIKREEGSLGGKGSQLLSRDTKPTNDMTSATNTLNQAQLIKPETSINLNIDPNYKVINDHRKADHESSIRLTTNIKINSNNITRINMINNRYVDSSFQGERNTYTAQNPLNLSHNSKVHSMEHQKNEPTVNNEEEDMQFRAKLWEDISDEFDYTFPSTLYKLDFNFDQNVFITKGLNKYLRSQYKIDKLDIIKDWRNAMETLLTDYISVSSEESVLVRAYILLFLFAFYIENDAPTCKQILFKMKEVVKNFLFYDFETLSIVNLFEGLIVEKKNYIESEEFYSRSLIFSLLKFGDPRGRGSFGSNFYMLPIWKLARQTCILENSLINENFKEMFHCQDHLFRLETTTMNDAKGNSLFLEPLKHNSRKKSKLQSMRSIKNPTLADKLHVSAMHLEEDIDENLNLSVEEFNLNYNVSDSNFNFSKFKYFTFPTISDVKSNYQSYFTSQNFLTYIFRNMLNVTFSNTVYDEEHLNKLGLNCYSIMASIDIASKTGMRFKSSITRKDKTAIFSPFMYEFLLDKLSYKKCPPDSILLAWGNNTHNQTTHNNYDKLSLPRVCYKLKDEEIAKLSSGWEHNVIVTEKKEVYSWGNNESGQCGLGEVTRVYNPCKIEGLKDVKSVTCGNEHSLALLENGDVFSWGRAEDGVLGYMEKEIQYPPKQIDTLKNIKAITSGSIHNVALDQDGRVHTWGCSKGGQLGHSDDVFLTIPNFQGFCVTPLRVKGLLSEIKISKVSCGEAHSLALSSLGTVFGWGFTSNGQLGLGICEDSFEPGQGMQKCRISEPRLVPTNGYIIIDIQCGKTFSTFITRKYELLVCGVNDLNQLGIEMPKSVTHLFRKEDAFYNRCCDVVVPTLVECFLNMKVHKVACGESHCLATVEDLSSKIISIWSWGSNRCGQLGQGSQVKKSLPKPINYILGFPNSQVTEISCGAFHSLCLLNHTFIPRNKDNLTLHKRLRENSNKWQILLEG